MLTLFLTLVPPGPTMFWIIVPFLPGQSPISSPYFTRQRRFYLSLHPLLPPPFSPGCVATVHLDDAPVCRPLQLICTSLPCRADQMSSSRKPVPDLPCPFSPPFRPRPAPRSLSAPGFARLGVPSSICLSPST